MSFLKHRKFLPSAGSWGCYGRQSDPENAVALEKMAIDHRDQLLNLPWHHPQENWQIEVEQDAKPHR